MNAQDINENTPRQKPLLVPWTWGEYYAIRYLAGIMRMNLGSAAKLALWRGVRGLAKDAIADLERNRKPVPQRLALLAAKTKGEDVKPPG